MKPNREQLRDLLRTVAATEPREITCEELLTRVGAYLESKAPGSELPPELELVAQHLEVCQECREEYEALVVTFERLPDNQ